MSRKMTRRKNRSVMWGIAVVVWALVLGGIISLSMTWGLRFLDSVLGVLGGSFLWVALVLAIGEIRARLKLSPIRAFLRKLDDWPITAVAVVLMAAALYSLWRISQVQQMILLGALVALAVATSLWAREALKPLFAIRVTNDGNVLSLPIGANLMQSFKTSGYELFAQCGGKGTCATCRVKIVEGFPEERRVASMYGPLNEKLRKEGWILSCQVHVASDMTTELFKPLVLKWPTPVAAPVMAPSSAPALPPAAAKLRAVLPGFDCLGCGYPTCEKFAEALATNKAKIDDCYPGGRSVSDKLKTAAAAVDVKAN